VARNLVRALALFVALIGGSIYAGAANANTYTLELFPLFGNTPIGSGSLIASGTGLVTEGSITIGSPAVSFSLDGDFVTINAGDKLTSITGLDLTAKSKKKDSLLLAFLGGIFTETGSRPELFRIAVTTDSIGGSVAATPLPATWTMMLIGLVGLGFVVLRRAKNGPAAMAVA
jgi:hypothetical protein